MRRDQVHPAGAFSSALLLFGISQVYGLLGTTRFDGISEALALSPNLSPGLIVGLVLIIAGLGSRSRRYPSICGPPTLTREPPYRSPPTWLSVPRQRPSPWCYGCSPKALMPAVADWQLILVVIAALTMVIGNVGALVQRNIKRLLAYSSIGHVVTCCWGSPPWRRSSPATMSQCACRTWRPTGSCCTLWHMESPAWPSSFQ